MNRRASEAIQPIEKLGTWKKQKGEKIDG